jgi:hypothetical protein
MPDVPFKASGRGCITYRLKEDSARFLFYSNLIENVKILGSRRSWSEGYGPENGAVSTSSEVYNAQAQLRTSALMDSQGEN